MDDESVLVVAVMAAIIYAGSLGCEHEPDLSPYDAAVKAEVILAQVRARAIETRPKPG